MQLTKQGAVAVIRFDPSDHSPSVHHVTQVVRSDHSPSVHHARDHSPSFQVEVMNKINTVIIIIIIM